MSTSTAVSRARAIDSRLDVHIDGRIDIAGAVARWASRSLVTHTSRDEL
jgi:hypothetical protein